MQFVNYLFVLFLSLFLLSCPSKKIAIRKNKPQEFNKNINLLVKSSNQLAFKFLKSLNATQFSGKNLVFSPLSIDLSLVMLQNGAAGQTFSELSQLTGLDSNALNTVNKHIKPFVIALENLDRQVDLTVKNSLWLNAGLAKHINGAFLEGLRNNFQAKVEILPFDEPGSVEEINSWTAKATKNKIRKLINHLDGQAFMVLINAVFFEGQWKNEFDINLTSQRRFWLDAGNYIPVPTMYGKISSLAVHYDLASDFYIFELLYGSGKFSMVIIQPSFRYGGVDSLISNLNLNTWDSLMNQLEPLGESIDFYMPKFSLKNSIAVDRVLKSLSVRSMFDPHLSGLQLISPQSYVSNIFQKAYIKVDEKGSVAAAATATTIGLSASLPEEFRVNKPFVFAIRERSSGLILFLGIVRNPLE